MKLGVLFSGGKDSCYALFKAMQEHEVVCLISLMSKNKESYMFHTPNINLVEKQAECLDLPIIIQETKGIKEEELKDLEKVIKEAIKKYKIEGLVTGAIESVYQSSRIQKICDKLNIKCINPLWKKNIEEYWNELIKNGFEIIITAVAAQGLDESWLGKKIDLKNLEELKKLSKKYQFHLGFEGGEAETLVINGPIFKKKINILKAKKEFKDNSGVYTIEHIEIIKK
ncbi:MAG: TIGR00289 family protein [Candidatus Nanoarchaeia archaeon]|nr:TIGR00289 family protein [Candidatus Nanoarchaeia archaeon]MDD5588006.1 TIGR00289 family protein [Candidatus Nanoarchaeia archaeon]